jgi:hypothetical protein
MQFGVIYLAVWGSTKPCVLFLTLEFCLISVFLVEHAHHWILLHCISQCLLCLVSSLFNRLMDGACLPHLAVKMPNEEGSLLIWGGCICHNPQGPPCKPMNYRYSRLTVCTVSPLCEVCVSNVIYVAVTLSRNVFQWCASESDSDTSSVMSWSASFLHVAVLLNALWWNSWHTTNPTHSDWRWMDWGV